MELLRAAGCPTVYIDGSFVSNKQMPADFDACWELDGVNLEVLDPLLLRNENRSQLQKLRFGGELFFFRLQDAGRSETMFDFFQADKATGEAKGIVAIDLQVKES
ncbi:hypothetical protein GKIL_0176 [Gloeobacter kilaueensis JS1]|uniref:Uncharacterized protein n=2 Tax=Gloeobacter TaxID=33071 RepID=U5QC75_GLOK1|nr:hypothetical protein GKIL_0176 [Gloeobacter kilaueensis JS1]